MLTFAPGCQPRRRSRNLELLVRATGLAILLAGFSAAALADSRDAQRREAQRRKAEFDRKQAEMKRKSDQRMRAIEAQQQRKVQEAFKGFENARAKRNAALQPVPFDAASAPPPEDCLNSYIAAARQATSMEQLLDYLPLQEQTLLKANQSRYDPKDAAASRERWRQQQPTMDEHSLTFLTNSAYANALDHHKSIANKFSYILSVKTDGNLATIVVATNSVATSGGTRYPYGKATIELLGEANYWRLSSYNDSISHYQEPPQKP